jgi:hypothetical protein
MACTMSQLDLNYFKHKKGCPSNANIFKEKKSKTIVINLNVSIKSG